MEKQIIEVSTGTILKILLIGAVLAFLFLIRDIIGLFILAMVIAYAFEPAIAWLQTKKTPRVAAAIIVYFLTFAILSFLFYIVVPPLFAEVKNVILEFPALLEKINFPAMLSESAYKLDLSFFAGFENFINKIDAFITQLSGGFLQAFSKVFGGVFSFILIIVLSFYLAVQEKGVENFIKTVSPSEYEDYILKIWKNSSNKIGFWLEGQILLSVIVATLVFLALTIIGIKHALPLAVLAGLLEIFPIFGPIIAAIPAVALGLSQSPLLGLLIIAVYLIIQQIENHLIYPVVVSKIIGVPPLVAIFSLIIGGKLAGLMGFLLAIPITVIVMEIMADFSERKAREQESRLNL